MTTTMLDVEAIEVLDFTPACGSPMCEHGHPVATHVGSATCGCHCLLCLACAEYLITKLNEPCAGYDCSLCGRAIDGIGRFGDFRPGGAAMSTPTRLQLCHIDHVVPRAHGGTDESWNLVAACQPCNNGKRDSLPEAEVIERALNEYKATIRAFDPYFKVVLCSVCTHPVQQEIECGDEFPPQCTPCNLAVCDAYDEGVKDGRRWSGVAS